MGLRAARTLREASDWLVVTDYSNAFNAVNRTAVLAGMTNCMPAITSFVAKCSWCKTRSFFFM